MWEKPDTVLFTYNRIIPKVRWEAETVESFSSLQVSHPGVHSVVAN